MKHPRHYLRRDTDQSAETRAKFPKVFFGMLAPTAATAVAVAVDYFLFGRTPSLDTLRFPMLLLGFWLLFDIYKLIKHK